MNEINKKIKENKMSKFMNAVKNSEKVEKSPDKKKASGAVINPSAEIKESIDMLVKAKSDLAVAKADIASLEPEIIEVAREVQDADALKGNFRKSYELRGNGSTVKFVSANKFSIAEEDIDDLKIALGDDFDNLITTSYTVRMKAEVFENDDLSDELMELLGDRFGDFFETITNRKVCEDFDKKLYDLDPDIREDVKELAKQAKPALR